jgi:hypothetical protein
MTTYTYREVYFCRTFGLTVHGLVPEMDAQR